MWARSSGSVLAWAASAVLLTPMAAAGQTSASRDYPQWRGQHRDGAASAFVAPAVWPETLTRRWTVDVGEGYATPIVVGPHVYTFSRLDGDELVSAWDAASGSRVWQTRYAAPYLMSESTRVHGAGPKSTPLFHRGRVFTLGITNVLSAFNATDGTILWQKPAPALQPTYSTAMSPLADGSRVIFHVGSDKEGTLMAVDAVSGKEQWRWSSDGAAFGSPVIAPFAGTRTLVTLTAQRLVGLDVATGRLLWERPFKVAYDTNALTPLIHEGWIIVSGHDAGTVALRPRKRANGAWELETRWHTSDVEMKLSNGVIVDDVVYGFSHKNSGQLFALDTVTGAVLWKGPPREAQNSALVKAAGLLMFLHDDARLHVARPSRTRLETHRTYTVANSATWAQPTLSGNRVFVKDLHGLSLWTVD